MQDGAGGVAHGGGGGVHDGGGFHGGGLHDHPSHDDGFHRHSNVGIFLGAPFILGDEYGPYGYVYPYAPPMVDGGTNYSYYYCRDPAGYYPDVQTCPGGWLQVLPNDSP